MRLNASIFELLKQFSVKSPLYIRKRLFFVYYVQSSCRSYFMLLTLVHCCLGINVRLISLQQGHLRKSSALGLLLSSLNVKFSSNVHLLSVKLIQRLLKFLQQVIAASGNCICQCFSSIALKRLNDIYSKNGNSLISISSLHRDVHESMFFIL
jgi:hypothetical protein